MCKQTPDGKQAVALSHLTVAHHTPFLVRVTKTEGHVAQSLGAGLHGHWLIVAEPVILKRAGQSQLVVTFKRPSCKGCLHKSLCAAVQKALLADTGKPTHWQAVALHEWCWCTKLASIPESCVQRLIQAAMLWPGLFTNHMDCGG